MKHNYEFECLILKGFDIHSPKSDLGAKLELLHGNLDVFLITDFKEFAGEFLEVVLGFPLYDDVINRSVDPENDSQYWCESLSGEADHLILGLVEHIPSILHSHVLPLEPEPPVGADKGCDIPVLLNKRYLVEP